MRRKIKRNKIRPTMNIISTLINTSTRWKGRKKGCLLLFCFPREEEKEKG